MKFAVAILIVLAISFPALAEIPGFDFRNPDDLKGWRPTHDLAELRTTPDGLLLEITGPDPFTVGPVRDYPADVPLKMTVRLRPSESGSLQVYYFARGATEDRSVRADVRADQWSDVILHLPPIGPRSRIRIDPPGDRGQCVIRSIHFEEVHPIPEPKWPGPTPIQAQPNPLAVQSGSLSLHHAGDRAQAFSISVADQQMAIGWNHALIGYAIDNQPRWLKLDTKPQLRRDQNAIIETTTFKDEDGATWQILRRYSPASAGAITVQTRITVDRDRQVLFLPMLGLFPGVGSFGSSKTQALFPGLEYLSDEPSSSQADVIGPASKRQVPNTAKITFLLMAAVAKGRYIGLVWDRSGDLSAVFDSPDRLFNSTGHAMALIFPGSDGNNRVEGNLLPYDPVLIPANKPIESNATIIGGTGNDVTAAVRQYVSLKGLPPLPATTDRQKFYEQAAAGWLDSKIREGDQYRHAYPGRYPPHPAADAALYQTWLATRVSDAALRQRLQDSARSALAQVPPESYDTAAVSHVRYPVASLVYGNVEQSAAQALARGKSLLSRFEPDGSVLYHAPANGPDLGKTNPTQEADGLAAPLVEQLLEEAAFTGDRELTKSALRVLHALDKFAGDVPRGAQTWEVPLHTPDILASAHLLRAYTLGYQLTGDPRLLDIARYWAWTGVPFIYLASDSHPVGPYAGIAVFGATQWHAPVWMGLPVQWCALVYADALYRFLPFDPTGPWKQLADGITLAGIDQSWPKGSEPDRQGLLPDSFSLRSRLRRDPGINPATLMAEAVRLYTGVPLYDFSSARKGHALIHAPGKIDDVRDADHALAFSVQPWTDTPCRVLISGLSSQPHVKLSGQEIALHDPHLYSADHGWLVLQLQGPARIELDWH